MLSVRQHTYDTITVAQCQLHLTKLHIEKFWGNHKKNLWALRPDVATVWGFGLCCVACAVRVGGLLVRPSVWLLWWLWWACFGCLVAVACFSVVALLCPCRFGAFFCPFLPFSVVGWCLCLSVAFRGNLGHLSALFGGCHRFWLVGATPSLFLGK